MIKDPKKFKGLARIASTVPGLWFLPAFIVPGALIVMLMGGCSGIKTYSNTMEKNLSIRAELDESTFFSKLKASVDIYSVDSECRTLYKGTVKLRDAPIDVGLPSGRMSYLDFIFERSSSWRGLSNTISKGTLLKPRKGIRYDITASYMDNIYYVEVFEKGKGKKSRREVELRELGACKEG